MLALSGLICYLVCCLILGRVCLCWWQQQSHAWRRGVGFGRRWLSLVVHLEHLCKWKLEDLGWGWAGLGSRRRDRYCLVLGVWLAMASIRPSLSRLVLAWCSLLSSEPLSSTACFGFAASYSMSWLDGSPLCWRLPLLELLLVSSWKLHHLSISGLLAWFHSVLDYLYCGTSFQAIFYAFPGRCRPSLPLEWSRCCHLFQQQAAAHVSWYLFYCHHQMRRLHWMCGHCSSFFGMEEADHLLNSLTTKQRQLLLPLWCLWVSFAVGGKGSDPRIVEVFQQRACFVKSNFLSCWQLKQAMKTGSLENDKLQLQQQLLQTCSAPAANWKRWLVDEALGYSEWHHESFLLPEISSGTYLSSEAWMIVWRRRCCWLLDDFSARASERRFAWVVTDCCGSCPSAQIFLWPSSAPWNPRFAALVPLDLVQDQNDWSWALCCCWTELAAATCFDSSYANYSSMKIVSWVPASSWAASCRLVLSSPSPTKLLRE